jgi:hypothetical protein
MGVRKRAMTERTRHVNSLHIAQTFVRCSQKYTPQTIIPPGIALCYTSIRARLSNGRLLSTSFHPTAFRETFLALAGLAMMFQEPVLPGECFATAPRYTSCLRATADKAFLAMLCLLVSSSVALLRESLVASGDYTRKRLLAGVRTLVIHENCTSAETSFARRAHKRASWSNLFSERCQPGS